MKKIILNLTFALCSLIGFSQTYEEHIYTTNFNALGLERNGGGGIGLHLKNSASTWEISNGYQGHLYFRPYIANGNLKIGFGKVPSDAFMDIETSLFDGMQIKRNSPGGGVNLALVNGEGTKWNIVNGSEGFLYIHRDDNPSQPHKIVVIGKSTYANFNRPYSYNPRLAVDGKILCEEIKVELSQNWGDFVFDENYDLNSLEETESYIKENKHLPGIPSADSLDNQGGIELGEMQRLQMIKIEELTLHMIEINKEKKELAEENKTLIQSQVSLEEKQNLLEQENQKIKAELNRIETLLEEILDAKK